MPELSAFVEVLYATPKEQRIVQVPFVAGMTAAEAVERSGIARAFPDILQRELVLGSFGVQIALDAVLFSGQRIEICRPLKIDPRDARRRLARRGRTMGPGVPG